jgi:CHAD domain-containing protein
MREREAKLVVPDGFRLPELGGPEDGFLAEPQAARRYTTTYWDTPDLLLARWGASLRHRSGEGWTVKLPPDAAEAAGVLEREERTFQSAARRPPAEAAALVRAYVRGGSLGPVAKLRAVRRPVALRNAAGDQLAELVDDEVQILDGARVAGRFRELEVELGEAAQPDTMDKILARLLEAGASQAVGQPGKYRRALGERELAPELELTDLDRSATVEQLLRHDLVASTLRVFRHEAGVRLGEDPEAVHQARVGVRRLRSTLRTFRRLLDQEWAGRLRDELKWLAGLLGDVRDADVLGARLAGRVSALRDERDAAVGRQLLQTLTAERDAARGRLLEALDAPRYTALLDDLVAAAKAPAVLPEAAGAAVDVAPPLVAKAWRRLRKEVQQAGRTPPDAALHQIRIRAKRARYAAEAVQPVLGKPARRFAKAAADLQDELGEQHDAVVAEAWLRDRAASSRAARALVAGQLIAEERAAARAARERWWPAWTALASPKRTSWL